MYGIPSYVTNVPSLQWPAEPSDSSECQCSEHTLAIDSARDPQLAHTPAFTDST